MDDNHPFLEKRLKDAGLYLPGDDRASMYESLKTEAAFYSPEQRVAAIKAVEDAIADDESNITDDGHRKPVGSIRQRSQLLNVHRSLTEAHLKLKMAGR